MPTPNNITILIENGFVQDMTYRGRKHVKFIHAKSGWAVFSERGTNLMRYTAQDKIYPGTLSSSLVLPQKKFEKMINEWIKLGIEEGQTCNRDGCTGKMGFNPVEGYSCHLDPPCNACVENPLVCMECGEEA